MIKVVNCVFYEKRRGCCTNKNIKKDLFGLGSRKCKIFWDESKTCEFQEKRKKALPPPKLYKKNHFS